MFTFNTAAGATPLAAWGTWLVVLASLFIFNEIARRFKWAGFASFAVLPIVLTGIWIFAMSDTIYTDWFHLAKVYSATIGSIGFWLIRHYERKDKLSGRVTWRLADVKWALVFPAFILAVNILEAVIRDFEVGFAFWGVFSGPIEGEVTGVMGGPWNVMNGIAGILNILAITGWFGIVIRKETKGDKSRDMLWPDMLWFWVVGYDVWNFAYTYNCIPTHSWYAGLALLLAPTICAFTVGKGAWLQHRAQTLAIWCMFAQTFPNFQDSGATMVRSTYNPTVYTALSATALAINALIAAYMIVKATRTKRNPYGGELYTDLDSYRKIRSLAA